MAKTIKKLLIVDDHPIAHKIAQKLFEQNGYQVVQAWDGKECLDKAKAEQPAAILLDVILPDMDGKEVAKQLLADEQTKSIPIIFVTNTVGLEEDRGDQAFDIDGQVFRSFAKPLHTQKILSVVRKEINRSIHGGDLPKDIQVRDS